MQKIRCKFTVSFESPFWVGVYERTTEGKLQVCKITFGSEPKDCEMYDFLLDNWHKLHFGLPVEADTMLGVKMNPKRMQREIKKQLSHTGIGTKAQQAIQQQREAGKTARKIKSRLEKEQEKERQFSLRQERKKQRHKGH